MHLSSIALLVVLVITVCFLFSKPGRIFVKKYKSSIDSVTSFVTIVGIVTVWIAIISYIKSVENDLSLQKLYVRNLKTEVGNNLNFLSYCKRNIGVYYKNSSFAGNFNYSVMQNSLNCPWLPETLRALIMLTINDTQETNMLLIALKNSDHSTLDFNIKNFNDESVFLKREYEGLQDELNSITIPSAFAYIF